MQQIITLIGRVYSVDSYDGNGKLCLVSDSPIEKSDGTMIEVVI